MKAFSLSLGGHPPAIAQRVTTTWIVRPVSGLDSFTEHY